LAGSAFCPRLVGRRVAGRERDCPRGVAWISVDPGHKSLPAYPPGRSPLAQMTGTWGGALPGTAALHAKREELERVKSAGNPTGRDPGPSPATDSELVCHYKYAFRASDPSTMEQRSLSSPFMLSNLEGIHTCRHCPRPANYGGLAAGLPTRLQVRPGPAAAATAGTATNGDQPDSEGRGTGMPATGHSCTVTPGPRPGPVTVPGPADSSFKLASHSQLPSGTGPGPWRAPCPLLRSPTDPKFGFTDSKFE
jgi:hypothetical protein